MNEPKPKTHEPRRLVRVDRPEPLVRPRFGLRVRLLGGYLLVLSIFSVVFVIVLRGMNHAQSQAAAVSQVYAPLERGLSSYRALPLGQYLGIAQSEPEQYPVSAEQRLIQRRVEQLDKLEVQLGLSRARTLGAADVEALALVETKLGLLRQRTLDYQALHDQRLLPLLERDPNGETYGLLMEETVVALLAAGEETRREAATLAGLIERQSQRLLRSLDRTYAKARQFSLALMVAASLFGAIIAVLIGLTLNSLTRLGHVAGQMASGDYDQRIRNLPQDELGALGQQFNNMARSISLRDRELSARGLALSKALDDLRDSTEERERDRARLAQAQRLAVIGSMAAQVAHEVRNPLNAMGLNTELLEDEIAALGAPRTAESFEILAGIRGEISRLAEVTDSYLELAHLPSPQLAQCDLEEIVRDLLNFLSGEHAERGVSTILEVEEGLPTVEADTNQIRQSLLNLIRNAADAMGTGEILLAVYAEDENVVIRIRDHGPGMAPSLQARIFDPFYSTKKGGTGLGLPITQQIVAQHGGSITCESTEGNGTEFLLALPKSGLPT